MKRKTSLKVVERNVLVLERIKEIKLDHPFWGYRRIWAYLKYVDGITINKKRVLRLMRDNDLLVKSNMRIKAKRESDRSKPKPTVPNQWWGIDMTKVMVNGFGWIYMVVVLDWYTKKIVGHYAGIQCRAAHWLEALEMAVNTQFPNGARDAGLRLMSDNGSQPTSVRFMKECNVLGIHRTFTSYNNPKGNSDTERVFRTMKEDLIWLREWDNPAELMREFENWIWKYNNMYPHSSLAYKSPVKFENEWNQSHMTQLQAA